MLTPESIARSLDGEPRQQRELFHRVFEIVDRAAHFTLSACRMPMAMKEDLVQEIVERLFRHEAKILRAWDPERATLAGYLRMIASRFVRRRVGREKAARSLQDLELLDVDSDDLDGWLAYRAALEELLAWVQAHGNDKDQLRFEALYVERRAPAEVARQEGLSVDAIYAWRSRFRRRLIKELPHVSTLVRDGTLGDDEDD